MMATSTSMDDDNRSLTDNERQDTDNRVCNQGRNSHNVSDTGSQDLEQERASTSDFNARSAQPTERVERHYPPTPPHEQHSRSQHNATFQNQPTAPGQPRVYRLNRNIAPNPHPPLGQRLLDGPAQQRQSQARDGQPSVARQGQPGERDVEGEVSPPLILRANQVQGRVQPQQQQQQQPQHIRSGRSHIHSFVRFVNQTLRKVNILWLNYEGERVRYKTLHPNQFVDVNTFVGHPWIFRDADTGDKLVVQLKEVYEPVAYTVHEGWPPQRRVVKISIPVYSLQERCMQVVRDLVPADKVDQLEIPQFLRQVIQQLIATKSTTDVSTAARQQQGTER